MNNFSPSTDTSVGTKRFTAQEVQLAYTLMAVEYMKTIKGLNPNHQLVDKAVKLKALGFTNSKEVGDAITSEEDLKVLKCYSFLQRHFPGSLILKEEDFINLNVKYGLVVGRLSAYKGSVPDENIDEISKVMATAQALEANEYVNYSETVHLYGMLLVCKLLLTLCLLIACSIRLEGTSLGRNLPVLNLCI